MSSNLNHLLTILLFFCCMGTAYAQNPYSIVLNKEKGLPSNNIYDIMEDSRGFKWISTDEGLSRYDGIEFITYKSAVQSSYPGSCIREDVYGRIWYENFDGYLYYVENDSLKALEQAKPIQYISFGLSSKYIFVLSNSAVVVYDLKRLKKTAEIKLSTKKVEHACSYLDRYYLICEDRIYCIDKNLKLSHSEYFVGSPEKVKQIYPAADHLFIVSKMNEKKQLYRMSADLEIEDSISISFPEFIHAAAYIDSAYWINSPKGSYIYDLKGKLKNHYFENLSVSGIVRDYQQNYWFGSIGQGIHLVPGLDFKFKSANGLVPAKIALKGDEYFVASKKGDIFISGKDFQSFKVFYRSKDNLQAYLILPDSISNQIFFASNGFSQLNAETGALIDHRNIAFKELVRIDSTYMAFAASGMTGLLKTSERKSEWDEIFNKNKHHDYSDISTIFINLRGKTVSYDQHRNIIYFGTNNGLYWSSSKESGELFLNGNEKLYANKLISCKDQLFVLSSKGTLYEFKGKNTHKKLNTELGFTDFEIRNIKLFNERLYIFNSKYIYELDLKTNIISRVSPYLHSFDLNDFFVNNNNLVILSNEGIFNFNLRNLKSKIQPRFIINKVIAGGSLQTKFDRLSFTHRQNNISINFSILEFGERSYDKLYYAVNNGDKVLIPDYINKIELPSLSAGNYLINFYIDNKKLPEQIQFTIVPPIWKRAWFAALIAALSLSLIYWYYRYQTGLLRGQVKLLNEKVALEHSLSKSILTSIKSQMNPHFFYNALNTIQAFIYTNDKSRANTYLAKFSKLTRLILEQSELEYISLSDEIDTLKLYLDLEKMRFNNEFEYGIEVKNIENKAMAEIPPMLIQPYVENAIKHGLLHKNQDKKLLLSFELSGKNLIVNIDDNGIGRKKAGELNKIRAEKFESFSGKANEKRLEILNKAHGTNIGVQIIDKYHENGSAAGTTVILTIPIH